MRLSLRTAPFACVAAVVFWWGWAGPARAQTRFPPGPQFGLTEAQRQW